MPINVAEILIDAASNVGVTEYTGQVSGQQAQMMTRLLNSILLDYSINEYMNYRKVTISVPATAMAKGYLTVGSADPANDIPYDLAQITSVTINQPGQLTYPTLSEISYDDYLAIPIKYVQSIPEVWAFDYQDPLGKMFFNPLPLNYLTITVIARPLIARATSPTDTLTIPSWYQSALIYDLASRLSVVFPSVAGFNTSIGILAKGAREDVRRMISRSVHNKVNTGLNVGSNGSSYWQSPLNNAR